MISCCRFCSGQSTSDLQGSTNRVASHLKALRGHKFQQILLKACNKTPTERRQLRHLLLIGDLHMACVLVPDVLWNLIEPLLPIPSSKPQGGRPRLADRACLAGVIFVLRSGIPWRMLPKALGCGSGMTCWRRLRDWQQDGIWDLIHFALLDYLSRDGQIDWSRAVIDSCSVRAVFGGG